MRYILVVVLGFMVGSTAYSGHLAFEKTKLKMDSEYSVEDTGFYSDNDRAGVVVHLSNEPSQPEYIKRYDDNMVVAGLSYDESIGRYGALVYFNGKVLPVERTVCAIRTMFTYKSTGNCVIEVKDDYETYTVRLQIK